MQGIVAKRSAPGTKTAIPLFKIRQTIFVVTRNQMALASATSVSDALIDTSSTFTNYLGLSNRNAEVVVHLFHYIPDHDAFCAMVESALSPLRIGELDKVVLSRLLQIESIPPLSALNLWLQLNRQNPESYNFHLPLADGTLIGASPELLLRKEGNVLRSCPLAGSVRRGDNTASDRNAKEKLLVSGKDRHEHRVVTEAIRRQLTDLCQSLTIPEPSLFSTPTLWHLATEIQGILANDRDSALSLACLLHPTPALCGAPYTSSRNLIGALEPFDRGWFGGIVGWCDARGNGEWVVAIRCGKVRPHQIELFAGAGIVPDSVPENEWMETHTKFNTMLNALGFAMQQEQTL
ncbi:Putative isochorismate synthase PhbC (modular protein) [Xenorhabdus bovienii SS-2004]|uniref:isochorismate synthase n=2 Tax=Xenorhabdus bovienii TaxID=40576 RepID=D3V7C2_XENBS|nr:Putative isochorismate synthase PhbC (modular protein) [Xenorhabdus bovienii SS-2004]